ncbi:hypothetical protein [Flavobacterium aquidurense]|uniref:hypothetical protein n=1 Tax=Flavobacterium aquidurense TaxID=362413 RepID=UPI00285DC340|nr:hypothetical protein [Flavobacterium aquidurense]MDR7372047.1 hypothetical protein [Flavobacterium aquidurense]
MKVNFKMLILVGVISLGIISCDNQDGNDKSFQGKSNNELKVDNLYDANSSLKREFGKALMKSLKESKMLRDLIKNESLKMFDNDYEVLYQIIKNEKLENNLTVRESILKNLGSEELLNQIEFNNPTLTILVPELPENSFSAKIWDTANQVPKVAIRLTTSNDIPIINQDGSEEVLEAKYTPGFPVIVLKDNERIVISSDSSAKNIKTSYVAKINGLDYKFIDDCFDGSKKLNNTTSRTVNPNLLDSKIVTAYDIYTGGNVDGWQRDYIYYNITPSSPKGPFKYDFQEGIKSFSLQGDPTAAYNKIADQTGDTYYSEVYGFSAVQKSAWTGGYFEFKVRIIVNAKNGVGSEIIKYFTAKGEDLFDIKFRKSTLFGGTIYIFNGISALKKMDLNIPIFNWDLDQYASSIKIDIEEVDLTETTVLTDSRTVKFATNFSIEGTIQKVGLKFGASLENTSTATVQKTFTQGNDMLGEVIVNFADNIIVSKSGTDYTTREYNSGLYSISVEPMRVQ